METGVQTAKPSEIVAIIQGTDPDKIAQLDFVKEKYVNNYNLSHQKKDGELMYHRQMIAFTQAIQANEQLKKADKFSLYACFVTAGVKGWSLDPTDGESYMVPRGGKAYIQAQAPAHVKRLQETSQIVGADQVKLVYVGDEFIVENGRVVKHSEKYTSEIIIAGYVRFILDATGADRYFIYRKSDWESWRSKSPMPNGPNWNGANSQPLPAFLRTKIILHASKAKTWGSGTMMPTEQYNVIIDDDDDNTQNTTATDVTNQNSNSNGNPSPAAQAVISAMNNDHQAAPVVITNDDDNDPFA